MADSYLLLLQHKFFETNQSLLAGMPTISQLPPPDIQASTVPRAVEPGRPVSPADQAGPATGGYTQVGGGAIMTPSPPPPTHTRTRTRSGEAKWGSGYSTSMFPF